MSAAFCSFLLLCCMVLRDAALHGVGFFLSMAFKCWTCLTLGTHVPWWFVTLVMWRALPVRQTLTSSFPGLRPFPSGQRPGAQELKNVKEPRATESWELLRASVPKVATSVRTCQDSTVPYSSWQCRKSSARNISQHISQEQQVSPVWGLTLIMSLQGRLQGHWHTLTLWYTRHHVNGVSFHRIDMNWLANCDIIRKMPPAQVASSNISAWCTDLKVLRLHMEISECKGIKCINNIKGKGIWRRKIHAYHPCNYLIHSQWFPHQSLESSSKMDEGGSCQADSHSSKVLSV